MKTFIRFIMMRDRPYITSHKNHIDGLVIDSYILETFQNASSSFITSNGFSYIIDPATYRFQTDLVEDYATKRWFERLVDQYDIEDLLLDDGHISMDELSSDSHLERFTENVIKYQENRIKGLAGYTSEFMSWFEGEETGTGDPYCIIPPYFIIKNQSSELDINIQAVEIAKTKTDLPIYPLIAIHYDLIFDRNAISDIFESYSETEADGFFFWITDFSETREKGIVLKMFKDCISNFGESVASKEVINMYGGYFSTMLSQANIISGCVHGIGMSESRDPYSLGGPSPTRYYVPIIHRMLSPESAKDLLDGSSFECECNVCQRKDITDMKVNDLIEHILNCKIEERDELEDLSLEQIREKLLQDYSVITSVQRQDIRRRFMVIGEQLKEWIQGLE